MLDRINIYDVDQTTISGGAEDVFDVAFVPGFTSKYFGDVIDKSTTTAPENGEGVTPPTNSPIDGRFAYYTQIEKKYRFDISKKQAFRSEEYIEDTDQVVAYGYEAYSPFKYGDNQYMTDNQELWFVATVSNVTGLYKRKRIDNTVVPVSEKWDGQGDPPTTEYYRENRDANNEIVSIELHTFADTEEFVKTYSATTPISPSTTLFATHNKSGGDIVSWSCGEISVEARQTQSSAYTDVLHTDDLGLTYSWDETNDNYLIYTDVETEEFIYVWTYTEVDWEEPTIGQLVRCNTVAEFKKQFGNTPVTIWKYIIAGVQHPVYSEKAIQEFAKEYIAEYNVPDVNNSVDLQKWITANIVASIVWVDRSWLYACELLMNGIPVFYHASDVTINLYNIESDDEIEENMRSAFFGSNNSNFRDIYRQLADKGEYNIKYLTVGAFGIDLDVENEPVVTIDTDATDAEFEYPFYEKKQGTIERGLVEYLVDIANYRKDCLVLVDGLQDDNELLPDNSNSVYNKLDTRVQENAFVNYNSIDSMAMDEDDKARSGRRAACTFPWYKTTMLSFPNAWRQYRPVDKNVFIMPGSFAYLIDLATSIQKYESASWEAIAGVTRALVPNFVSLYVNDRLTNAIADAYNKRNATGINAITNIRPYGYCIWGNRTLVNNKHFAAQGDGEDGVVASSFVDIMSMVCNVNKVAYRACKRLMFEKNNEILWVRFLQAVSPYLDQLATGGAIENYEIQREESTMRGQLVARIVIWPVYSVENFDIAIVLRDQETTVES